MPVAPKSITPAMLAEARRLYTRTQVPVEEICTLLGIGTYTFYQRRKQWGWPMRSKRTPKDPPPVHPDDEADASELDGAVRGSLPAPRVRTANLVALLHDATEREFAKLDRIASRIGDERGDLPDMQNALRTRASAGRMAVAARARRAPAPNGCAASPPATGRSGRPCRGRSRSSPRRLPMRAR
jgi:hypothetical protein